MRPAAGLMMLAGLLVPGLVAAATYHVAPGGNDGGPGSAAQPWATLQHAADTVAAGDTVLVAAGDYAGFDLRTSGTPVAWIVFEGQPGARIVDENPVTDDGINVENVAYVVIAGFTVEGMARNGIRAAVGQHITIRDNQAFDSFERGILTGFVDDLLIEGNETAGAIDEHGIYVSNSGDRPVIRGNRSWGNNGAGIHMNGDLSAGGDGIISGALVESNLIWDNGPGGGSGINCDGVQDSVFRNNMILGNHASGISLYAIDGAEGSRRNLVVANTIVMADDGRWGINVADQSTENTLRNNVVLSRHSSRGSLAVTSDSLPGLVSDHNVLADRMTTDGGDSTLTLAQWQALTGQDAHSFIATEAELFVNPTLPQGSPPAGDYRLQDGSPAADAGTVQSAPPRDFEGDLRPIGPGFDVGADEWAPPCDLPDDTLELTSGTVTGTEVHEACSEIGAGAGFGVAATGDLTLRTRRRVILRAGFSVAAGGGLVVEIDPVLGSP